LLQIVSRFQIFYRKTVWIMLNRLLFFCVKIAPEYQHFAALAREPKQMSPSLSMISKALVTFYKIVYESCRLHAPVRKYSISKLVNNQEPSDQNSARILRILFSTKLKPHCASLVRKSVSPPPQSKTNTCSLIIIIILKVKNFHGQKLRNRHLGCAKKAA
jgi:hypothetical protein